MASMTSFDYGYVIGMRGKKISAPDESSPDFIRGWKEGRSKRVNPTYPSPEAGVYWDSVRRAGNNRSNP